jgi:hypothetical protein
MNYSFKMEFKDDGKPNQMTWSLSTSTKARSARLVYFTTRSEKKNENRDFEQFFFSKKWVSMV